MNSYRQLQDKILIPLFKDVMLDEIDNTKKYTLLQRAQIKEAMKERSIILCG